METKRILIVDDHEAVRSGLRSLLLRRGDWIVCGEAKDGIEAVEQARKLRPDAILMDISMPRMDGLDATRIIRKEVPGAAVIMISQNDPATLRDRVADADAQGFVGKTRLAKELIPCIEKVFTARTVPVSDALNSGRQALSTDMARYFPGDSEMARRMRTFDWSTTSVGIPAHWPENLLATVRICLTSRFPIVAWWGRDYTTFYNDAYRSFLGRTKHPQWLGRSGRECWREIWPTIGPMLEGVFATGDATWSEDLLLTLDRNLAREEGYFTFSYSPVLGSRGGVDGIFCACYETTDKVVSARRLQTLRKLAAQGLEARTADAACEGAAKVLGENPYDIPFSAIYLMNDCGTEAELKSLSGLSWDSHPLPLSIPTVGGGASPWPFATALKTLLPSDSPDLVEAGLRLPGGPWLEAASKAVVLPVLAAQHGRLSGLAVLGVSPRRMLDDSYRAFFNLIAAHIGTAISDAQAYEAEQKRAEALAELDRAKTAFFSNVSHEFRTPLALMLGPLEDLLARSETHLSPLAKGQLELVSRNGARLLRLVNTLLDFSRIEAGRIHSVYQATDISAFTAELASAFRSATERAGLQLLVDCRPLEEPVYLDRDMWEKIVLNLVSNAFKFTFEGEIAVSVEQVGRTAELRVRDTGIGIPQEAMPRLFERFHRIENVRSRTHEGSGIGLALVQEIVKLHEGSIRVESEPGEGSTFIVNVPLGQDHLAGSQIGGSRSLSSTATGAAPFVQEALRWLPEPPAQDLQEIPPENELLPVPCPPASRDLSQDRPRVLIADDNADMRQYLARLLGEGYEVQTVADGQLALESIRARPPDLILSDIMMPNLDGIGLLHELRSDSRTKTVPIILLSARAGEEARVEGLNASADDYLVKPFSSRELLARVQSHLELARVRREANKTERENAEVLRAALTASNTGTFRWNPNTGEYLAFDDNLKRLFGKGPDTPFRTTEDFTKLVHPEDLPSISAAVEACRDGADFSMDYRVILDDGSIRWLHHRAKMEHDTEGRPTYLVGACTDITYRKHTEEALVRRSDQFETLLNGAPLGVYLVGANFRIIDVNPTALPMFGDIPSLIGRDFDEVIHILWNREYADEIVRIFWHTLETGESYQTAERIEHRNDRNAAEAYEWRIDRIPLPEGGYGVVCYFRDISAQVKARLAIQESEERYRQLVETLEVQVGERTRQLESRNADVLKKSKQLHELTVRLMRSQDEERRRIARDLHDSAGQIAAVLAMMLDDIEQRAQDAAPEVAATAAKGQGLIQQLTQEIRATSYLLHPPLLDENGLPAALRSYVRGVAERSGLNVELSIPENFGRLPEEIELAIFRVIQEALTNVLKHSGSKNAWIRLSRGAGNAYAEIEDQGCGIPREKFDGKQWIGSGVGIDGMRERVQHLGGELTIESAANGTKIALSFPATSEARATSQLAFAARLKS